MLIKSESGTWCSACGYSGSGLSDVVRHIEAKHMDLRIPCRFCSTVCKTQLNIKRHLKKYHPETNSNIKAVVEWHLQALK